MQHAAITKPNRVKQAQTRLEAAIGRLERALTGRDGGADTAAVEAAAQVAALRDENAQLKQRNDEIGARLDAAIGRLARALGD